MAGTLAAEDDIRIVGQTHSMSQLLLVLENSRAQVLVLSSAFLRRLPEIKRLADRRLTAILLIEEPGSVVGPQRSPEVHGVMQRSADEATVIQCVRHLARGGRVFRLASNQSLACRPGSVRLRGRQGLSQLELRIVSLVVQGRTNREIATQLGSTEQGIKNSLRRIFDKTGVLDRLELALTVLHRNIASRSETDSHPTQHQASVTVIQATPPTEYRRAVS